MSQTPPSITAETLDRFCSNCGYNLRGITSTTCPECGLSIGAADVFVIPWENRKTFGRFSTFVRTAALATFRPKRFATAIGAPIDDRSARRFRLIVVLLAALPIVISLCGVMIAKHGAEFLLDFDADFLRPALDPKSGRTWQLTFVFFAGATMPPVLPIGVIITFCLGLSAPGLWFRAGGIDEQRQMRLIAISRYACAPWAWLIVPTAAFVAALWIANVVAGGYGEMDSRLLYSSGATMLFVLISAWWTNIRMLARTTRCGVFYMLAAGISLPVTWAVSAAIGLGLFPCVVGLVWIIIDSLRR